MTRYTINQSVGQCKISTGCAAARYVCCGVTRMDKVLHCMVSTVFFTMHVVGMQHSFLYSVQQDFKDEV